MEPAVSGLESEEQFVRFGTSLGVNTDSPALGNLGPPPQGHVGSTQRAEVLEERRRIVRVVEAGRPGVLVEADERRLVLGQDPAVAGGGDQL
jgi:hypothetical protein